MPPVLADEMEKEELNLIKVSLMDYVNTAALEFISGKRDLDADWDAYVKDCEGKGNQELSFLVPEEEGKGVRRIAVKVANGISKEPSVKYRGFCKRRRKSIWGRMELSDK